MAMQKAQVQYSVRLTSITVLIAVSLLIWQLLIGVIPYFFQLVILGASLFFFGIPHGALDHLVQQETLKRRRAAFNLFPFLLKYLAVMALYALAWYLLPQLSLIFFILMSGWHFGETDVNPIKISVAYASFIRLFYGLSVLALLLFAHKIEVSDILIRLIPANSFSFQLWIRSIVCSKFILIVSGLIIVLSTALTALNGQHKIGWQNKADLLLILFCGYFLPLLPAFALYFSGWHSIITLYNINDYLEGSFTDQINSLKKTWVKTVPLTMLAISGLIITGYLLRSYAPLFDPLPLLFVFLSLITLPHLGVMHLLNRKEQH